MFEAAFPEVRDGDGGEMSSYSPSRVIMTAGLLAPVDTEPLAVTSGEAGKEETGAGSVARPVADGQDSSAETAAADSVHDNTGDAGLQERVCASGDDGAVSSPPSPQMKHQSARQFS